MKRSRLRSVTPPAGRVLDRARVFLEDAVIVEARRLLELVDRQRRPQVLLAAGADVIRAAETSSSLGGAPFCGKAVAWRARASAAISFRPMPPTRETVWQK